MSRRRSPSTRPIPWLFQSRRPADRGRHGLPRRPRYDRNRTLRRRPGVERGARTFAAAAFATCSRISASSTARRTPAASSDKQVLELRGTAAYVYAPWKGFLRVSMRSAPRCSAASRPGESIACGSRPRTRGDRLWLRRRPARAAASRPGEPRQLLSGRRFPCFRLASLPTALSSAVRSPRRRRRRLRQGAPRPARRAHRRGSGWRSRSGSRRARAGPLAPSASRIASPIRCG